MDIPRLFPITTTTTSSAGTPGFDYEEVWQRFYDKYRRSCIVFLEKKYPLWASEAEDVFMMTMSYLKKIHGIARRRPTDRFRTILCNQCVKQMRRLHSVHRETARRTFARRAFALLQPGHADHCRAQRARILQIVAFVRNDLLDPDYQNGVLFPRINPRHLDLWRIIQDSETSLTTRAKQLGIKRQELKYAKLVVDKWIVQEATKIAKELHYLD